VIAATTSSRSKGASCAELGLKDHRSRRRALRASRRGRRCRSRRRLPQASLDDVAPQRGEGLLAIPRASIQRGISLDEARKRRPELLGEDGWCDDGTKGGSSHALSTERPVNLAAAKRGEPCIAVNGLPPTHPIATVREYAPLRLRRKRTTPPGLRTGSRSEVVDAAAMSKFRRSWVCSPRCGRGPFSPASACPEQIHRSSDGTRKIAVRLRDGALIEIGALAVAHRPGAPREPGGRRRRRGRSRTGALSPRVTRNLDAGRLRHGAHLLVRAASPVFEAPVSREITAQVPLAPTRARRSATSCTWQGAAPQLRRPPIRLK
jgi:hypothetical protein